MFKRTKVSSLKRQKKRIRPYYFIFMMLFACMLSLITSCDKEQLIENTTPNEVIPTSEKHSFWITNKNKQKRSGNQDNQTILGEKRTNPYTVDNMLNAWNTLYPQQTITDLEPTDLYIKLLPTEVAHIDALDHTDIVYFDYPLEYEVIEMGNYYIDPTLSETDFPVLYAVVSPNFSFSAVPYEVITPLFLPPYDADLTAMAFSLTNNTYDGDGVFTTNYPPPCDPGSANWPDCLGGSGSGNSTNSDCGCTINADSRKPGGCVWVEDTALPDNTTVTEGNTTRQASMQPVRRVQVIAKDGWFRVASVMTTDNGCFTMNKIFTSNNISVWVRFKNNRAKIRGAYGGFVRTAYSWAGAIKLFVGDINGGIYNNININYLMWEVENTEEQIGWGAATVNNGLHEFYDYAAVDGLTIPSYLNLYVAWGRRGGAAPMAKKIGGPFLTMATTSGIINAPHFSFGWPATIVAPAIFVAQMFPDIMVGIDRDFSDGLKSTVYHELAHAAHFEQAGIPHWLEVIRLEVANNGYGDGRYIGAGRVALAESWGEHIGMSYAHLTYGSNSTVSQSWDDRIENTVFWWDFIPAGLHNDLIDIGEPIATGVVDNVSGLTNNQLYNCLQSHVNTIDLYQSTLKMFIIAL